MSTATRRTRGLSGVGIALAAFALAGGGCARMGPATSSGTGLVPVSATNETTATATSGSGSARAFTACVRENGVENFPGITITGDGQLRLNVSGSGVNVLSEEYRKAVAACQHLLPKGSTVPTDPEPAAPSVPDLGFTCDGTCPKMPKAPAPPR